MMALNYANMQFSLFLVPINMRLSVLMTLSFNNTEKLIKLLFSWQKAVELILNVPEHGTHVIHFYCFFCFV